MARIYFKEDQRFKFKIIWTLILSISVLMFYGFYTQIIGGTPFGDNPAPDYLLVIFTVVFGILFPLFFFRLRMITIVDEKLLTIKFFPFKAVSFHLKDIQRFEKRSYSPLNEFGGWGIKQGFKIKCYTMSGKMGVQVDFKNGRKILIGSQKADELEKTLIQLKIKN